MDIDTPDWASGPLHAALVRFLPTYVREPFSPAPRVKVLALKDALSKSHETVYKWLRNNRLSPRNARAIVDLANSEENSALLKKLRRVPPQIKDFEPFYLA